MQALTTCELRRAREHNGERKVYWVRCDAALLD